MTTFENPIYIAHLSLKFSNGKRGTSTGFSLLIINLPDEDEDIVEVREAESPEFLKSGSHARRSLFPFL